MEVEKYIKEIIYSQDYITIDHMMSIAMTSEHNSYYKWQQPLGKEGDFITAPEISQMFGEMIGMWCVDLWYKLGSPPIELIELGPGKGTLLKDALNSTKHVQGFHNALHLNLVEINYNLKKIQSNNLTEFKLPVKWFNSIDQITNIYPTIILANEFFDVLPIKQYVKISSNWYERVIKVNNNDQLYFDTVNIDISNNNYKFLIEHFNAKNGAILEISPLRSLVIKAISNLLKKNDGGALIIDYGYDIIPNIRTSSQYNCTLQSIKKHQYQPLLQNLGSSDISSHVDFLACKKAAMAEAAVVFGTVSQNMLLHRLGIKTRLEMLKLMNYYDLTTKLNLNLQYDRLTSNKGMGELFKAIAITSSNAIIPLGFNN